MAIAAVKIRIMPESPQVDLALIEKEVRERVEALGEKVHSVEKEPIAFGLVALNVIVVWPEEKNQSILEDELRKIENVQSAEVIDFRRAVG